MTERKEKGTRRLNRADERKEMLKQPSTHRDEAPFKYGKLHRDLTHQSAPASSDSSLFSFYDSLFSAFSQSREKGEGKKQNMKESVRKTEICKKL